MNQPTAEKPYNDSDVADVYRRQKQSTALLKLPMNYMTRVQALFDEHDK